MSKVVVVGAGASGIIAALKASERHEVILLEKNDKVAKKILLTGNGRCNYWNNNIAIDKYNTDDETLLNSILENGKDTLEYLDSLGLYPRIKNDHYYPYSNQAYSVREVLETALEKSNIKLICNAVVTDIIYNSPGFTINYSGQSITADKVIMAPGSKAYPKTGTTGDGYTILEKLGHNINPVYPALGALKCNGWFLTQWSGIRVDASVKLMVNGSVIAQDEGEMQLTDYGVSGICVFNLCALASKNIENNNVKVHINFMPYLKEGFISWLEKRCESISNLTIAEHLESVFSYKLTNVFLKEAGISKNAYFKSLTDEEKNKLDKVVSQMELEVVGTNSFDKAQICTGGLSLKEIDSNLESKTIKGLYITGEILDVDGKCGGYNLAFAFITGYKAGKEV